MPPPPVTRLRLHLAFLDEEVLSVRLTPDEPSGQELVPLRPTPAAAVQEPTGRGVERETEHVLGFDEIRHEPAVYEEVSKAKDVGEEDEGEDDVEHPLPPLRPARGVVVRLHGRIEPLVLRHGQGGHRGRVIPEMNKRRVQGTGQQRVAG